MHVWFPRVLAGHTYSELAHAWLWNCLVFHFMCFGVCVPCLHESSEVHCSSQRPIAVWWFSRVMPFMLYACLISTCSDWSRLQWAHTSGCIIMHIVYNDSAEGYEHNSALVYTGTLHFRSCDYEQDNGHRHPEQWVTWLKLLNFNNYASTISLQYELATGGQSHGFIQCSYVTRHKEACHAHHLYIHVHVHTRVRPSVCVCVHRSVCPHIHPHRTCSCDYSHIHTHTHTLNPVYTVAVYLNHVATTLSEVHVLWWKWNRQVPKSTVYACPWTPTWPILCFLTHHRQINFW